MGHACAGCRNERSTESCPYDDPFYVDQDWYPSKERAEKRVRQLRRDQGIAARVVRADGGFEVVT